MPLTVIDKRRLHVSSVAFLAALGLLALGPGGMGDLRDAPPLVWYLGAAVIVGATLTHMRLRPPERSLPTGSIGLALPAAFGLLLAAGTGAAVLVLAVGLVITAAVRRSAVGAVLHVAVPVTALLASGLVLTVTTGSSAVLTDGAPSAPEVAAIVVAGVVLFVVQVSGGAVAIALTHRLGVRHHVATRLATHLTTGAILLSIAPVAVVLATSNPLLITVLALPVLADYRNSRLVAANQHLAHHDALTGLPNRRLYLERLAKTIQEAVKNGHQVAVLLIDLDRFKEVNDRLGHHVGDLLLQAVAPALTGEVADDVTVARMGGDEFALCVPEVDGGDEAVLVAKRVIGRLTQPFHIESFTIDIGASIGIALVPTHASDVSTAMQRADIAMYVAKESRGGYEVYSAERDPQRRQRIRSPGELRRATEMEQLVVHFQPVVEIGSGQVRGVEALVRWNHPELGLVGPREFVPLAERAGLMGPLTTFVLARSLAQIRRWADAGHDLRLSLNVSVQSLYDETFPEVVAGLLEEFDVPASRLVLDVTENAVMADPRRSQGVLALLEELGVTLAVDDFGTGYSSLSYLKQLPVSQLKIDSSFVLGMARDSDDAVIVLSTIDLGRRFGLQVVAQGVESNRVLTLLGKLGCDLAQGWYMSAPQPAESLSTWLAQPTAGGAPLTAVPGNLASS